MRFIDDKAVIVMLFRSTKSLSQTFSAFCQWCGDQRVPIHTPEPEHRVLMCVTCDLN